MNKRKIKIKFKTGEVKEINLEDIVKPIVHESLSPELLCRIKNIYEQIRECYPNLNLETFEVSFMRDNNPENEIHMLESLLEMYKTIKDQYPNKRMLLEIMFSSVLGCLTEEEEKDIEIIKIKKMVEQYMKNVEQKSEDNNAC